MQFLKAPGLHPRTERRRHKLVRRLSRDGAEHPSLAESLPPYLRALGELAVPTAAVGGTLLITHRVNPNAVGTWGLITVTPWPIFLIAAVLSLSFFALLRVSSRNGLGLCAHVFALALLLHGLPSLLEQEPRFSTAWLHAGFVSAIIEYKHPLTALDARFSWPGFFTGVAAILGIAGQNSAVPLLRWTPLVLNIAYVLPVYIIARTLLQSRTRAWLVIWLFLLTNWVGQDYFSPQGASYFLLMAIMAILVYAFASSREVPGIRWLPAWASQMVKRDEAGIANLTTGQGAGLLLVLLVASLALNMSHQLTPVILTLDVTVLVLARRCALRYFPLILLVLLLGWISYGAVSFWSGHLGALFGSGGTQSVSANVSQRITGSSPHVNVVYERLLLSAVIWVFAAIGVLRAWRSRRGISLTAIILALAPFPVLLAQSYGGEAQLRLYFYTLPFMLILGVAGLPGELTSLTRRSTVALAIASSIIVPLLLIARFGNEQFEQVRPGEITAIERLYQVAPKGATLVSITPNVIWRYRDLASYDYKADTLEESAFSTPHAIRAVMGNSSVGSYLLITRAQTAYVEIAHGYPSNWGSEVESRLALQPQFHLIYENPDARIYDVVIAASAQRLGAGTRLTTGHQKNGRRPARRARLGHGGMARRSVTGVRR